MHCFFLKRYHNYTLCKTNMYFENLCICKKYQTVTIYMYYILERVKICHFKLQNYNNAQVKKVSIIIIEGRIYIVQIF